MSDTFTTVLTSRDGARETFVRAMNHAAAMFDNGESVMLSVGPALEPISIRQRKFLKDIVCGQIAEQVKLPVFDAAGNATGKTTRHTKDVWAEYFRAEFLGDRYEMKLAVVRDKVTGKSRFAKKATPHKVRVSTEHLGVRKYSEHIDRVIDTAILEFGVEFHFTREEREAVRWKQPKRATQQAEETPA